MSIVLRAGLLLLLTLVAALFLWQNLTPLVSVVFLGVPLPELPLSLWIAIAFLIGMTISLLYWLLITLTRRSPFTRRTQSTEKPAEPWNDEDWETPDTPQTPTPPRKVVDAEFRVITPPQRNLEEE